MAHVRGFRAYRFDPAVVGDLSDVVTPPFDVITPEERESLLSQSPYNMARVLLPEAAGDLNPYESAAHLLDEWIKAGALRRDDEESFYLVEQRFRGPDGKEHIRRGFFGVVGIPEPGEDTVLDHERTFDSKVRDRLALTRATRSNLGAVFGLYDDPEDVLGGFLSEMENRPPDAEARTMDGAVERLWRVPEDDAVKQFLSDKIIYIADGHHRFRTAREYRQEEIALGAADGARPYDFALMGFVRFQDPGLAIWPTHRLLDLPDGIDVEALLSYLREWFEVRPVQDDLGRQVEAAPGCTLGVAIHDGGQYTLTLDEGRRVELLGTDRGEAWRSLDVAVLHRGILERFLNLPEDAELTYEPKTDKALAAVQSGKKQLGFFLKGITPAQIRACAEVKDYMPEKATYFFPKLPSGAVIHRFE